MNAAILAVLVLCPSSAVPAIEVRSPNGRIAIHLFLQSSSDGKSVPYYRVRFDAKDILRDSRIGVLLGDSSLLGGNCEVVGHETRRIREEYAQVVGKRRNVTVSGNETVVRLRESQSPQRTWNLALRAYDDGVAFQYRFPQQMGWNEIVIAQEQTEFRIPERAITNALPLNGFNTSYEKRYETKLAERLPTNWLLGLPLLFETPSKVWAAITEADVVEYGGLYLSPTGAGSFSSRISPLPKEPKVAVRHSLPHVSPWRVILVGDRVGQLIESDVVLSLSRPCAIEDTSWIKTGKTTFPWWNGFYEEKVGFTPGLNTATAKHYIDFCAEAGIPYHSIDGMGNTAWYGGPIAPYQGADPTIPIDGLDLRAVLEYATAKGVRIRLWMNWKAASKFLHAAFPKYREWGIEGVMLDFMDRDDQEMNRFVREAVALAAKNRLTVTLHGCPKPTGLERTYPNLLTHEGVMNLEYDKWDKIGILPEHEVTIPFTRMLAGPLDFHQGSFRTVALSEFKPRNRAPLVIGTAARTLASYVIYQNHLPMVADYPSAYRGHPALQTLTEIPTNWHDVRVPDGKVGEYVAIARRDGDIWHVGAMTNREARTLEVSLGFLKPGRFTADIWRDDAAAKFGVAHQSQRISNNEKLTLKLAVHGGAYVKLTPSNE